jgi:putative intracellular protease/amidase/YHS domain-containing protein
VESTRALIADASNLFPGIPYLLSDAYRWRSWREEEAMQFRQASWLIAVGVLSVTGTAPASETAAASTAPASKLVAPAKGRIPVAFVLTDGAVVIDFAGPWEVFQDTYVPTRSASMDDQMPFELYTVSDTRQPIQTSGGMRVVPDHTFDDAPPPKIIVIPAQGGVSPKMLEWIRKSAAHADVVMSVCTGAFVLAKTGLLSGKAATTHHSAYRSFAMSFPDIHVERGARYVETGNLASAGGLSSGIDLALRVVERYFGREAAEKTAFQMEYQGQGWMNPRSNSVYDVAFVSTDEHPVCMVCGMDVDPSSAPKSVFHGKNYFFCSIGHKAQFDAAPEQWLAPAK